MRSQRNIGITLLALFCAFFAVNFLFEAKADSLDISKKRELTFQASPEDPASVAFRVAIDDTEVNVQVGDVDYVHTSFEYHYSIREQVRFCACLKGSRAPETPLYLSLRRLLI